MKPRYRQCRNGYLNCNKAMFEGVGEYDMPEVEAPDVDLTGCTSIGFDRIGTTKDKGNKVVHFYIDDYKFETAWLNPDRYIEPLKKFRAVIGPDFSSYSDFPWIAQVFNHYRRQWLTAYWQDAGVVVIPNVQMGYHLEEYKYCLDGIPRGGTIATSTVGGFRSRTKGEMWLERWALTLDILRPRKVILIGKQWPGIEFGGELIVLEHDNAVRMDGLKERAATA